MTLDRAQAERLAAVALGHVTREYPHAVVHVFDGPGAVLSPRALHPVFYGSFDWHSCVHGYWMLATLLRRFPGLAQAGAIGAVFDAHLADGPVEGECAYLRRPAAQGFERPYGWAWLLALQQAVAGTRWDAPLRPLSAIVAARFRAFLPVSRYPVRVGTHFNTAFALRISAGYAEACDPALLALLREKAWAWYGDDRDCQAWEPGQDDFLSSALIEAACLRRLWPERFEAWLAGFLPGLASGRPTTLFDPAVPTDRTDGKIAHLDGLNLSRAWCWSEVAAGVPAAERAAAAHRAASLPHVVGDFMGEHWLASFAVLALLEDAV